MEKISWFSVQKNIINDLEIGESQNILHEYKVMVSFHHTFSKESLDSVTYVI